MKRHLGRWIAAASAAAVLGCSLAFMPGAVPAKAADPGDVSYEDQLGEGARAIYDALEADFEAGLMTDGVHDVDITEAAGADAIQSYVEGGQRTLANDFNAAKDAFDLEHPEAWYVDSSFLTLRAGKRDGEWAAYVGPGRADTYYLNGQKSYGEGGTLKLDKVSVESMDDELMAELDEMADEVLAITAEEGESEESVAARRITKAHNLVTHDISYRFENECDPANPLFVRTTYAAHTHEGVCEGYARTLQYLLDKAGIECRLVNGMQTSGGNPEQHMWVVVKLGDSWYGVDPTWDDPVKMNSDGSVDLTGGKEGDDGLETTRYLLVGTDTLANWVPNGVFSAGGFEFAYPTVSALDYVGGEMFSQGGLSVTYSSAGEMEGVASGTFTVRFEGGGIKAAGKRGQHLLVKMYDAHDDGTVHEIKDWYYVEAGLAVMDLVTEGGQGNQYFHDDGNQLVLQTPGCDYVEFAMTTREPEGYENWWVNDPSKNNLFTDLEGNYTYYHGDGSDISCETGRLRNVNSSYESNPYMLKQYPLATSQTSPEKRTAKVIFDDALTYPKAKEDLKKNQNLRNMRPAELAEWPSWEKPAKDAVKDGFETYDRVPESEAHLLDRAGYGGDPSVAIAVSYLQRNIEGELLPWKLQGDVAYDNDGGVKDGYVDVDTEGLTWLYECTIDYPHVHTPQGHVDMGESCKLVGVEFEFDPSAMWADDMTYYNFQIEGLVGSRSGKQANPWGYLVCDPECPYAYRGQGIDWNLWGKPNLLDNPDDLNLEDFVLHGVDGYEESLASLQDSMNLDYLNGRLTLVVEDLSGKKDRVEEMEGVLADELGVEGAIRGRELYEIGFSNICRQTINDVETGDSMRIQVGFPEGYTAASEGVVFKAYHFERDEAGRITRVDEIPVVVTEYGLLVLCDSFSPFEMVALDADKVADAEGDAKVVDRAIVVASDEHVSVKADGVDANAGLFSVVEMGEFGDDGEVTFEFIPEEGYELASVTFAGGVRSDLGQGSTDGARTLKVTKSQLEALTDEGGADRTRVGVNAILSATSVPESVIEADRQAGFEMSAISTCSHMDTREEVSRKEPTCTEDGRTARIVCNECETVLFDSTPIQATGHVSGALSATDSIEREATCAEAGLTKAVSCMACGTEMNPATEISPKGHTMDDHGVCSVCDTWDEAKDARLAEAKGFAAAVLARVEDVSAAGYTASSWAAFANARAKVVELMAAPATRTTAEELKAAGDALSAAADALVKETADVVDTSALEAAVAAGETKLAEGGWTEETSAVLATAIGEAKALLSQTSPDKAAVDGAESAVRAAMAALVKAPEPSPEEPAPVDRSALRMRVAEAEAIDASAYTEDSVKGLLGALARAKGVLADEAATQADIDGAVRALEAARLALIVAESKPDVPPVVEEVDKTRLAELVLESERLDLSIYEESGVEAFKVALSSARQVLADEGADEESVTRAYEALKEAKAALRVAEDASVDKGALQALVDEVSGLRESDYTESTWAAFAKALADARSTLADEAATADAVKGAYGALAAARASLEPAIEAPSTTDVDKGALEALFAKATAVDLEGVSAEARAAFVNAMDEAREVLLDPDATQEAVDGAVSALQKAMDDLKAVLPDGGGDSADGGDTRPGDEGVVGPWEPPVTVPPQVVQTGTPEESPVILISSKLPDTGVFGVAFLGIGAAVAAGSVFVFKKAMRDDGKPKD